MPTLRTTSKSSVPISNPNPTIGGGKTSNVSIYEKCREERIKENRLRLQNLGILNLKSEIRPVKRPYSKSIPDPNPNPPPLQLSVSTRRSSRLKEEAPVSRRSSRLKNAAPVTYFEEAREKKGKTSKEVVLWLGEGERPEIYTEEDETRLGNTERIWELCVDGFDKNGKRIYDPVNGKTCHQCRQKTLGYHTSCSQNHPVVMGQFCGDCLYMRYGEHVLEARENPDWMCPVCRDICNCSICRKAKGWSPTGNMYRKVCKLGFKSVAHYLNQTSKESKTGEDDVTDEAKASSEEDHIEDILNDDDDDDETDDTPSQASAEASSEEDDLPLEITDGVQENHIEDILDDDDDTNENTDSAGKSLGFLTSEENQTAVIDVNALGDLKPLDMNEMEPVTPVIIDVDAEDEENRGTRNKRKMSVKPNPNSIGGRLRQRRKCQA